LETGRALGLKYPRDFNRQPIPEVEAWIEAVDEDSDPLLILLRFAAIEIIAESVSKDFLASDNFSSVLGERGSKWFRVHTIHEGGVAHEELELRLGFASRECEPTQEETDSIIQHIVALFITAADACAKSAREEV